MQGIPLVPFWAGVSAIASISEANEVIIPPQNASSSPRPNNARRRRKRSTPSSTVVYDSIHEDEHGAEGRLTFGPEVEKEGDSPAESQTSQSPDPVLEYPSVSGDLDNSPGSFAKSPTDFRLLSATPTSITQSPTIISPIGREYDPGSGFASAMPLSLTDVPTLHPSPAPSAVDSGYSSRITSRNASTNSSTDAVDSSAHNVQDNSDMPIDPELARSLDQALEGVTLDADSSVQALMEDEISRPTKSGQS